MVINSFLNFTITTYSYYHKLNINLVISNSISHKKPFILLTNGDVKNAVKDYSKRFGSIECIFKNQKSNGLSIVLLLNLLLLCTP